MPYGRTPKAYALENIALFVILTIVALVAIPVWNALARNGYDIVKIALVMGGAATVAGLFMLAFGDPILRAWRARKEGGGLEKLAEAAYRPKQ